MLILLGIFVSGALIFHFFSSAIVSLVSPVWKSENTITRSFRNSIALLSSQKVLVQESAELKERISSLETELLALSNKQVEGSALLELIGRKPESDLIAAAVLTHPSQTPYDIIVIDAGSDESISLGSEVFLTEGPVIGTISEVFQKRSKVRLFSSAGEETNAILERGNIPVTLVGTGGGDFKFTLPRDIAVEAGDRILSASIASHLLAVVGEIDIRSTDSFKEVLAGSPTNIFTLRFVFVTP